MIIKTIVAELKRHAQARHQKYQKPSELIKDTLGELKCKKNSEKQKNKKPTFEEIQKAAYLKWEAAGRPQGNDIYFWLEAEKDFK